MSNAREIIEYVKATGYIDLAAWVRVATREYLQGRMRQAPRTVELSNGHIIEILEDANFDVTPYWFFVEDETSPYSVRFYSARSEELAVISIEMFCNF
jgi:hypothetical protein